MSERQRVLAHPAYLLHRRAFRDTSQILELFTREHGRLAVVARGVRGARSRYRGVLEPFRPLLVSWSIRSELGTLTGAEPAGPAQGLDGQRVMAGFYLNELVMKLTHRHDPQAELFAEYATALATLATPAPGERIETALRRFELRMLGLLGYGLNLERDIVSGERIAAGGRYEFRAEAGPVAVGAGAAGASTFSGAELLALAAERLQSENELRIARAVLRVALDACLDGRELASRRVMRAISRRPGLPSGRRSDGR